MSYLSKESLDALRAQVDLVDLLSTHIDLKRSGASYKACCPFHDEKSPSFVCIGGQSHYHCYGCGAHGDAIEFLMRFAQYSFLEAVEYLAERYRVHLSFVEGKEKGPQKAPLRDALEHARHFFTGFLLSTQEGKEALLYLEKRHIDEEFIARFGIGLAPQDSSLFKEWMEHKNVSAKVCEEAGLLMHGRLLFSGRICFPITAPTGAVIGFSARRFREGEGGGKYINTPETPLFKKSKLLFGLSYCRQKIAKQQTAIVVEGQIDCLRCIDAGFDTTVAGQGTAFGPAQADLLCDVGVKTVFVAMDGDSAGTKAALHTGDILQSKGVDVRIVCLPEKKDPDSVLCAFGATFFERLLSEAQPYLQYLYETLLKEHGITPAHKAAVIDEILEKINQWQSPLFIHESKNELARLAQVPVALLGFHGKKHSVAPKVNPLPQLHANVAEKELLRIFFFSEDRVKARELLHKYLKESDFIDVAYREIFAVICKGKDDISEIACDLSTPEALDALADVMKKNVSKPLNIQALGRAIQGFVDKRWLKEREEVRSLIQSGTLLAHELQEKIKEFDRLLHARPCVSVQS